MVPFVWRDYDKNNTYRIDEWQRVQEFEELEEKILQLRDEDFFNSKLEEYRNNYKQVLLSLDAYYHEFTNRMDTAI